MSGALLFLFLVCEKIVSSIERPPSSLRAAPPEKGGKAGGLAKDGVVTALRNDSSVSLSDQPLSLCNFSSLPSVNKYNLPCVQDSAMPHL